MTERQPPAPSDHDESSCDRPLSRRFEPVTITERITAIDTVRGVAVLGILVINIYFFALPMPVFMNPPLAGGFTGLNLLTWEVTSLFFYQKMMAIFSMLFGAGLILMANRAEANQKPFGGVYYRRIFWLLIIGLVHAYLLWYGDILFSYAICGLLLYPLRRRSARLLIILGAIVLVIGILLQTGMGVFSGMIRDKGVAAETALAAGETLTPDQEMWRDIWSQMRTSFEPPPSVIDAEVEAYQGSFRQNLAYRFPITLIMQTQAFLFMVFCRVLGLMLLGMALMKLGVFSGERSAKFYYGCIAVGYAVGLPLVATTIYLNMETDFDFVHTLTTGGHFDYIGSIFVALGHIGVIMIMVRKGLLARLTRRLATVGRMALTNYLMQTIICTTIFYGFGFGLFGRIDRFALMGFVVGIWAVQLLLSPLWLTYFRFGPAEWLWRTLTYWRRQPMRAESSTR